MRPGDRKAVKGVGKYVSAAMLPRALYSRSLAGRRVMAGEEAIGVCVAI